MHPYAVLGGVILLIGTHAGAFAYGRHVEQGDQAQQKLDQALAYAGEIVARQGAVDRLSAALEAARTAQRPKDRIITREVIRYAQLPADRRCELDGAWRLLHDAAATGQPADTARVVAGSAPPVADAAALDTVAGNYEQCREYIDQVSGWQAWWRLVSQTAD
ncbi:hypothetical protein [Aromatoleum aromaticum]|uniref:hypothetical protein n=1 Tax=Aromatoleum aromaticum TaxID=551760 RepID=UPI0002E1B8A4|nr:hypothetical protein [Aromatoleum aromaticum]